MQAAAGRLAGVVRRTPLLEAPLLSEELGCRLLVKAENLQITGSFKLRGAMNKLAVLGRSGRAAGVLAFSSGNHAQGVAFAARHFGCPATVIMPADAPAIKIANTRAYGATIVHYDRQREDREAIAAAWLERTGAALVRPFDDPAVIAGQGTVGLETGARLAELDLAADQLLCPVGGGGLIAGIALAMEASGLQPAILGVEPEGFDDTAKSLASGHIQQIEPAQSSICDALLVPRPGDLTFAINRSRLAGLLQVSDQQVITAMHTAMTHFKLVVEPGGAVALAAILANPAAHAGKTVVAILSGGNVQCPGPVSGSGVRTDLSLARTA